MKRLLRNDACLAAGVLALWVIINLAYSRGFELSWGASLLALAFLVLSFYAASILALPWDFRWAQAISWLSALVWTCFVLVVGFFLSLLIIGVP